MELLRSFHYIEVFALPGIFERATEIPQFAYIINLSHRTLYTLIYIRAQLRLFNRINNSRAYHCMFLTDSLKVAKFLCRSSTSAVTLFLCQSSPPEGMRNESQCQLLAKTFAKLWIFNITLHIILQKKLKTNNFLRNDKKKFLHHPPKYPYISGVKSRRLKDIKHKNSICIPIDYETFP